MVDGGINVQEADTERLAGPPSARSGRSPLRPLQNKTVRPARTARPARMPWRTFLAALTCGSLPLGFIFAAVGQVGQESPGLALLLSGAIPLLLWLIAGRLVQDQR